MEKYNYGRVLYDENIFDLENDNDIFEKAVFDSYKMENYFLEKTPNINSIRNLIINSYRLNKTKSLRGKNRLYYTIGIAYSMEYINLNDLEQFVKHINLTPNIEEQSIFYKKGFTDNIKGFFEDAFEEDLSAGETQKYKNIENQLDDLYICTNCGAKIDANNKICPKCGAEFTREITINKDEIESYINLKDKDYVETEEYEDIDDDILDTYIDISARRKLELFNENFEEFINQQLERKNIEGITKTKFIIKGMRDWFNYCMPIFESALEIDEGRVMYFSNNIGKYL